MAGVVRIGCGSWGRAGLEAYAREFNSVEVNATFYRLASLEAVKGWLEQTPPDFEFSVKSSRYMTHKWRLRDTERLSKSFYEPLQPLVEAGRLGPTLWQLPGNYSEAELDEWAERIAAWRGRGDVYAYFNNDGDGDFARPNARGLKARLGV